MASTKNSATKQQGFSLVEMMVAIFLGSVLMLTLVKLYITSKHTYLTVKSLASFQERGRFISTYFIERIHRAGYKGCEQSKVFEKGVQRIYGYSSGSLPTALAASSSTLSDAFQLGECIAESSGEHFRQILYFIADTGRKDQHGKPLESLFEKILPGPRLELVSGVSSMKVHYGVSTPLEESVAYYADASQIRDWSGVKSIHIILQLSNGSTYRPWSIYVALKNAP